MVIVMFRIISLLPIMLAITPNYKPANYDRSATQFSPSGRLLQAEYALTASKRYINNEEQYFDTSISNSSNFTASSSSQITISAVTNGKSSCIVRVLPREVRCCLFSKLTFKSCEITKLQFFLLARSRLTKHLSNMPAMS